MIVGDDVLGVPRGTMELAQTSRLFAINHGPRRHQGTALRVCALFFVGTGVLDSPDLRSLRKQSGYVGLPQVGEGGPSKMVDEDVGIRFVGKCFGVLSFEDVHHLLHIADYGTDACLRFRYSVATLLTRAPSPTGLCKLYCLCTDGKKSRIAAGASPRPTGLCVVFCRDWRPRQSGSTKFAQTKRRRLHVIVGDDVLGVPRGTMELAQTSRLFAINHGPRRHQGTALRVCALFFVGTGVLDSPDLRSLRKQSGEGCT